MRTRIYRPAEFEPSGYDSGTPERKARFVNSLLRFIDAGYPRERFSRSLYGGLSTHGYFGFIAHYNIHGFYEEKFSTPDRQRRFLVDLRRKCERDAGLDRPDLWCDVKEVLAVRLAEEPESVPRRVRRARPFPAADHEPLELGNAPTLF